VALLAGGLARRMGGGDKCLRQLGGETLLARVIRIMRPQASRLVLNANGDPARFADFELPVIGDVIAGYPGPLAGVLSGMTWARRHAPEVEWLITVPTDAPFLPGDLVGRLLDAAAKDGAELACAASGGRTHPVIGAWRIALADALREAVAEKNARKIDAWTAGYKLAVVEWPSRPVDPFFNANDPAEMAEAERLARLLGN
jgi:molybdopterin-guanine dinucleotide biosynthesis protein A